MVAPLRQMAVLQHRQQKHTRRGDHQPHQAKEGRRHVIVEGQLAKDVVAAEDKLCHGQGAVHLAWTGRDYISCHRDRDARAADVLKSSWLRDHTGCLVSGETSGYPYGYGWKPAGSALDRYIPIITI